MTAAIGADVGRTDDRQSFGDDVRLRLVEHDLDRADERFEAIASEIARTAEHLAVEIAGLRKVLTGLLIAFTTGSVMLALNVIVLRSGS
jgi:hypothetical protein